MLTYEKWEQILARAADTQNIAPEIVALRNCLNAVISQYMTLIDDYTTDLDMTGHIAWKRASTELSDTLGGRFARREHERRFLTSIRGRAR